MEDTRDSLDSDTLAAMPTLPAPLAAAIARWESATQETLGPLLNPQASIALHGAILNLRQVLLTAAAAAS